MAGSTLTRLAIVLCICASSLAAPPELDLAKWNRAYKYTAQHVPAALLKQGSSLDDGNSNSEAYVEPLFPLQGYDVTMQCKGPSVALDPVQAKPGTCQYIPNKDGTYTYWEKQPGDWSRLSNCYCYALNVFKGSWCQPGIASGVSLEQHDMTCAQLKKAVLADGAVEITKQQAIEDQPANGHYIAMFLRPQSSCNFARCQPDYHFVRKDSNGLWSHKSGEAPATNRDAQGNLIKDPNAAKLPGQYTEMCGYFHVQPAAMKIGTIPMPNMISKGLEKWKKAHIQVSVEPLQYNPAVDAADASTDYAMLQQQMFALQRQQSGRKLKHFS